MAILTMFGSDGAKLMVEKTSLIVEEPDRRIEPVVGAVPRFGRIRVIGEIVRPSSKPILKATNSSSVTINAYRVLASRA